MSELFDWSDDIKPNQPAIPSSTRGEALSAVADMTVTDGPFISALKYAELKIQERRDERPEIGVNELNEMYPDLPEPFQDPKKPSVAAIIANRQRLRKEMQTKMSMGPNDYLQNGLTFGTGLVYGMMDPTVVAGGYAAERALLGAANSMRVLNTAAGTGLAAGAARGLQFLGKSGFKSTVARDVTAGLVEGSATEGVVALSSSEDMSPYTTEDFFMNTVGGAILMPAVLGGIRGVSAGVKKVFDVPPPTKVTDVLARNRDLGATLQSSVILSMENNMRPNVEPVFHAMRQEINLAKKPSFINSEFSIGSLEGGSLRGKVYAAINAKGDAGPLSVNLGNNLKYVTDNPAVANAIAGSKFGSEFKNVGEYDVDDLQIARLEDEIEPGVTLKNKLDQIKNDIRTGKLDDTALDDFYAGLKAKGFDGIGGSAKDIDPELEAEHNVIGLFDKPGEAVSVNKADVKAVGEDLTEIDNYKQRLVEEPSGLDPESRSRADELINQHQESIRSVEELKDYDAVIEKRIAALEEKADVNVMGAEYKAELEAIKAAKEEADLFDEVHRVATACIGES